MVGWNTVVVRSERGSQLLSEFIEAGLIETRILPEENLAHLKEASLNKRERGELAKEERRRKKT
jgi:coenzyme F420-reducing hydrogenase beta subunit